jgi:hypothetical protein
MSKKRFMAVRRIVNRPAKGRHVAKLTQASAVVEFKFEAYGEAFHTQSSASTNDFGEGRFGLPLSSRSFQPTL